MMSRLLTERFVFTSPPRLRAYAPLARGAAHSLSYNGMRNPDLRSRDLEYEAWCGLVKRARLT